MKTKVINVTGAARHFGFLPPHGRDMAADAELVFDGDLRSVIAGGRNRFSRARELTALDAACDNGDICLVEVAESCCASSSSE